MIFLGLILTLFLDLSMSNPSSTPPSAAMEPRTLDAIIAEKVMGWKRGGRYGNGNGEWIIPGSESRFPMTWDQTPRYSTRINDAWLVVERMHALGWDLTLHSTTDGNSAEFDNARNLYAASVDPREGGMPLAICNAALLALSAGVDADGAET